MLGQISKPCAKALDAINKVSDRSHRVDLSSHPSWQQSGQKQMGEQVFHTRMPWTINARAETKGKKIWDAITSLWKNDKTPLYLNSVSERFLTAVLPFKKLRPKRIKKHAKKKTGDSQCQIEVGGIRQIWLCLFKCQAQSGYQDLIHLQSTGLLIRTRDGLLPRMSVWPWVSHLVPHYLSSQGRVGSTLEINWFKEAS